MAPQAEQEERGGRNMKSMRPLSATIFFMTYFYRAGGGGIAPSPLWICNCQHCSRVEEKLLICRTSILCEMLNGTNTYASTIFNAQHNTFWFPSQQFVVIRRKLASFGELVIWLIKLTASLRVKASSGTERKGLRQA